MYNNEISDYKQLAAIRKKIDETDLSLKLSLKSTYYCGSKAVFRDHGVAVLANNVTAKVFGTTSCKSPWCCPVCTARQMAKYAEKIGAGIDALKEQGQYAAMITFTIPHTSGFSCYQATEILYDTWKAFTVHGNTVLKTAKNDIFSNFAAATNHKHRIRVAEYTWGNAGWHPHFHCLFWFPADKFDSILDWEEKLKERWLELAKRYTIKHILLGYPETQRKTVKAQVTTRVEIMYSKLNSESNAVYISKANGKPIRQESSSYICGWGGNREITGNVGAKATHNGHFTWQQILANAIAADKMKLNELKPAEGSCKAEVRVDAAQVPDWWQLYFEYATATRKKRHARVNFSVHSGLLKIIAEYQKRDGYKLRVKKNNTDLAKANGRWRTVCWFSASTWYEIWNKNLVSDVLRFAVNGGLTEINRLLKEQGFTESAVPPDCEARGRYSKVVEDIFNAA